MSLFDSVFGSGSIDATQYYQEQQKRAYADRIHIERMKAQADHLAMQSDFARQAAAQNMVASPYVDGGMANAQGMPTQPSPRFNPNDYEAFQVPMSQLITMWQLKFGDKWYDAQNVRGKFEHDGKEFWEYAFDRLRRAEKLEGYDGWFRLKEEA